MRKKMMASTEIDRLSDLPDALLIHILSFLPKSKDVAATSVLSKRWCFLWKSVPLSLQFSCRNDEQDLADLIASTNRELMAVRSFQKIRQLSVVLWYNSWCERDIDVWVFFATRAAVVEHFTLVLHVDISLLIAAEAAGGDIIYYFPQFAYKNSSLKNLVLSYCHLNPVDSVSWSRLTSLSIGSLTLTDNVMAKILSGCPNLECLQLARFLGLYRLEISSLKLRMLTLESCYEVTCGNAAQWLEILAPHIQDLQIKGSIVTLRLQLTNVESLVSALVNCNFYGHNDEDHEASLKELLHRLVHVKNLSLGPCCIEYLSKLEERGWQSPASSRKSLEIKTAFYQEDFSAICNLLQSSSKLETLVIDWRETSSKDILEIEKDEISKMFEKHVLDSSLLHLRTIKIITFFGPVSAQKCILPLVKHLLKNAKVLEKMVIYAYSNNDKSQGCDVSRDFTEIAQECLSFPRSSQNAVIVFTC